MSPPRLPRSGSTAPRSGNSGHWIDLIAFIAVLTLGGGLIALGHITAGSLTAICAALGGLFMVWMRFRTSGGNRPPADNPPGPPDELPRPPEPAEPPPRVEDLAGKDDGG